MSTPAPLGQVDLNSLPKPVASPSKKSPLIGNPSVPPAAASKEDVMEASKEKKGVDDEELLTGLASGGFGGNNAGSLQANFAKFRAERARLKKVHRANKKHLKEVQAKTPEQKEMLRKK